MNEQTNSEPQSNNPNQTDASSQGDGFAAPLARVTEQQSTENDNHPPQQERKASFILRILRAIVRPRRWRKRRIREHHQPVNWVEKSTLIVAIFVLLVTSYQAYIYRLQLDDMTQSLNQTERSVILNIGQLAVADRNAKTAEDTLQGSTDTFQIEQRPYIVNEVSPVFVGVPAVHDGIVSVNVTVQNIGKTPAKMERQVSTLILITQVKKKTPKSLRALTDNLFDKLEHKMDLADKEFEGYGYLNDLAPIQTNWSTADIEKPLTSTDVSNVSTQDSALIYAAVLRYTDAYHGKYETQLCYYFIGTDPKVWHFCGIRNTIR